MIVLLAFALNLAQVWFNIDVQVSCLRNPPVDRYIFFFYAQSSRFRDSGSLSIQGVMFYGHKSLTAM